MYSSRFTGIGRYTHELTEHLFKLEAAPASIPTSALTQTATPAPAHPRTRASQNENEYVLFFNEPEYESFIPPNNPKIAARIRKVLVNAPHYSLKEQTSFLHMLNLARLDLMHFTHFNAPMLYSRPFVVTIHDLTLSFFPGKKMASPLHRAAYHLTLKSALRKAEKIITVSQNTKKDLEQLCQIPPAKISVIYPGVNDDFQPIKTPAMREAAARTLAQKYRIQAEAKPYLLYTGVWRSHKNLPNLIKAFGILKNQYAFPGSLVITGRHDPLYANDLMREVQALRLEKDLIFTGLVDDKDLVLLYNLAAVYVFPSLYEGFGLPPLEAMKCGTPVAASHTSSIPEVCGSQNAAFFDPQNPADMAAQINKILKEPTYRQQLIDKGLKRAQDFSWARMAEQTLGLYKLLIIN